MTNREQFLSIMNGNPTSDIPFWLIESISDQVERQWYAAGDLPLEMKAADALAIDRSTLYTVNFGDQLPLPSFIQKTISKNAQYVIFQDAFGSTVKKLNRLNGRPVWTVLS